RGRASCPPPLELYNRVLGDYPAGPAAKHTGRVDGSQLALVDPFLTLSSPTRRRSANSRTVRPGGRVSGVVDSRSDAIGRAPLVRGTALQLLLRLDGQPE